MRIQGLPASATDLLERWRDLATALLHIARSESRSDLFVGEPRSPRVRDPPCHKKPTLYVLPSVASSPEALRLHQRTDCWDLDHRWLREGRNRTVQTMMRCTVRQDPLLRRWQPRPNTLVVGSPSSPCKQVEGTRTPLEGFARGTIYEVPKSTLR